MANLKRKLTRIACCVLVVALVLCLVLRLWLGALIVKTVNAMGPVALGVPVSIESASVNIFSGKALLRGIEIGNPEGFDTPYLFRLDSILVDLDLSDCFHGTTHIRDIVVSGPHVWYHRKFTESNLSSFLAILKEKYPSSPEKEPREKPETAEKKSARPMVIDHLLVEKGTIGLKIGVQAEIPLLEIELKDIGRDGAMMPAQVGVLLAESIGKGIVSAVSGAGSLAVGGVKTVGGTLVEGVRSLFDDSETNEVEKASSVSGQD